MYKIRCASTSKCSVFFVKYYKQKGKQCFSDWTFLGGNVENVCDFNVLHILHF